MASDKRFAVLIDAENVSDRYIPYILDELAKDGLATYKRIYGDWTQPGLSNWKRLLLENSIIPIQQYSYTSGKNSTDSAMIIDAMDILYAGNVEGFCLVSSDSDFTRLAVRLRESGMFVLGMGEKKTPTPFVAACNRFTYLDVIASAEKRSGRRNALKNGKQEPPSEPQMTPLETIKKAILTIIDENNDEDDWVFIGDIGNILGKRYPDFDVRNYGFNKLTPFITSLGMLEIKNVQTKEHGNKLIYVKAKEDI